MTIDVVFPSNIKTPLNIRRYDGLKRYRFICGCPLVKVGDVITSPIYTSKMVVTAIYPEDMRTIHNGIPLKVLIIDIINGEKLSSVQLNTTEEMTDKRNISIRHGRGTRVEMKHSRNWLFQLTRRKSYSQQVMRV